MVEVDVRQQEVADVRQREPAGGETSFECRDAARRAAVDDGRPIVGLDDIRGDGTLRAMVQVDRRAHPRASSVPAALGAQSLASAR